MIPVSVSQAPSAHGLEAQSRAIGGLGGGWLGLGGVMPITLWMVSSLSSSSPRSCWSSSKQVQLGGDEGAGDHAAASAPTTHSSTHKEARIAMNLLPKTAWLCVKAASTRGCARPHPCLPPPQPCRYVRRALSIAMVWSGDRAGGDASYQCGLKRETAHLSWRILSCFDREITEEVAVQNCARREIAERWLVISPSRLLGLPLTGYPSHNGVGFGLEIQRFRARTRVRLTGQARLARLGCG